MCLKGYVQNTTNALHFDHSSETFKALFPRMVAIIWVPNLAALLLLAVPFFPRIPYLVFWASNGVVHMPQQPLRYSFYLFLSIRSTQSSDSQTRLHIRTTGALYRRPMFDSQSQKFWFNWSGLALRHQGLLNLPEVVLTCNNFKNHWPSGKFTCQDGSHTSCISVPLQAQLPNTLLPSAGFFQLLLQLAQPCESWNRNPLVLKWLHDFLHF